MLMINNPSHSLRTATGFTLLEIMVTVIILALGMMGLGALILRGQQTTREAYDRVTALYYLSYMTEKIRANAWSVTTDVSGAITRVTPAYETKKESLPGSGKLTAPANSVTMTASPAQDLFDWDQLLNGVNKTIGGNRAGGVDQIFGCIKLNGTLTDALLIENNNKPDYLLFQPPTWLTPPNPLPAAAGELNSWSVEVVWMGGLAHSPNPNPSRCAADAFADKAALAKSITSEVSVYR